MTQLTLPTSNSHPRSPAVIAAVEQLTSAGSEEERGAIFTKRVVVEAILDLCGYDNHTELHSMTLLEPSFGAGDFLLPAIRRLIESFMRSSFRLEDAEEVLSPAIRGVELHRATFLETQRKVSHLLRDLGLPATVASNVSSCWLRNDDFLLTGFSDSFDFVVGNPPYVRQERIPGPLLTSYKATYSTLYDRADLYILFYERGLQLLREGGTLGYICANRWLKNKYGGPLRRLIAETFHLRYYIDLDRVDAFHEEVIAYPAITIVTREPSSTTRVGFVADRDIENLVPLARSLIGGSLATSTSHSIARIERVASGTDPWLLDAPSVVPLLRDLEERFGKLESTGVKVGIGVATGADRVYIREYSKLPVEPERKLRLAMAKDCKPTGLEWGGMGVVNPYTDGGQLAALSDYPLFAAYLHEHEGILRKRHTAQKQPAKWYKTIDRIYPAAVEEAKLLIPDIKGAATVVLDDGAFYPHHNLYVVTSNTWDIRALQALMRSSIAVMFVAAYCVRMSGGFLRFQAQYLRRIRCPTWASISNEQRTELIKVSQSQDQAKIDAAVLPLYGLTSTQQELVREYAAKSQVSPKDRS